MRLRQPIAAAGLLAALALTGCNGERTAEVAGTVTVDGHPAPTGSSITFVPADGMSSGGGATITDGKYTATEVPVGPARVRITVPRFASGKSAPHREGPGAREKSWWGNWPSSTARAGPSGPTRSSPARTRRTGTSSRRTGDPRPPRRAGEQ